jgi:hypothetical protein
LHADFIAQSGADAEWRWQAIPDAFLWCAAGAAFEGQHI